MLESFHPAGIVICSLPHLHLPYLCFPTRPFPAVCVILLASLSVSTQSEDSRQLCLLKIVSLDTESA